MNEETFTSLPDDWLVVSVDKIIEDTKHNRPPYAVTRLLKSNRNWLEGGILDEETDQQSESVFITFQLCPPDWNFFEGEWRDKAGRVLKGGKTMVLSCISYTIASGWTAGSAVLYGAEHESDDNIRLMPDEKMKLRTRKEKQKSVNGE